MTNPWKEKASYALTTAIGFAPMVLSIYLLYWFEVSKTWNSETAQRDVVTVLILRAGMVLSFLLLSYFSKRR
jgi:FtsH-binding integral membrane protein